MDDVVTSVEAQETISERGILGLEVSVKTKDGYVGKACAASGISMGDEEAFFLVDGGTRFQGKGVRKAARTVNEAISKAITGVEVQNQREIDRIMVEMDGTPNKSVLGGNSTIAVSLAVLDAAAKSSSLPLYRYIGGTDCKVIPIPIVFAGYGGRFRSPGNSRWYKPSFELVPYGAGSFENAYEISIEIKKTITDNIIEKYGYNCADYSMEVNMAGVVSDNRELLDEMTVAVSQCGYSGQVGIYVDMAAGCYYDADEDIYVGFFSDRKRTRAEMFELYSQLVKDYPLVSIEDPLHEHDFEGHAYLTEELGIEIVGDDLFTTNPKRLRTGASLGAANSMVLKVTQIGTVSEALDAASLCKGLGYNVHPCGSRGDVGFLADISVGLNTGQIRAASLEGNAGYKRLWDIEKELGENAIWLGSTAFKGAKQPWLTDTLKG